MAGLAKSTYFTGRPLSFDQAKFSARMDALAGQQLGYTVNNLPPADAVGLFAVDYKTAAGGKTSNE